MKLLIASDIHGSAFWCGKLMDVMEEFAPEYLILLGDLLYHGPRNDLPRCVRDMVKAGQEFGASWYCAGAISKKGHPHHPLYLRKDEKVRPFNIECYLDLLDERMK